MHTHIHGYKDTLNPGRDIRPTKRYEIGRGEFSNVIDRLLKKKKGNLSVYFGALKDEELLEGLVIGSRKEEQFFRRFFSEIEVLDFDLKAAEETSDIMGRLLSLGTPVNSMDVLRAGIDSANGAEKIVSRNSDFISIEKVSKIDVLIY